MTISASYGFNLTGAQVVRAAFRLAGVLSMEVEASAAQISVGLDFLNLTLKALQNEGIILSTIERTTQSTTAGTDHVDAAADTINVDFPAYITPTAGTNTTTVQQMQRDEYMEITDKTILGLPTRMYVERTIAGVVLYFYPVPDSSVASVTYARERLIKDMDASGASTPDLAARWLKFLTYDLAHDIALASSMAASKCQYLKGLAMKEREEAEGYDNEGGDIQWLPAHAGGWRGQ